MKNTSIIIILGSAMSKLDIEYEGTVPALYLAYNMINVFVLNY